MPSRPPQQPQPGNIIIFAIACGRALGQPCVQAEKCSTDEPCLATLAGVGGSGASVFFDDPTAHKIAKDFLDAGKLTTAICAAPSILANAGLLQNIRSTCFPSQADNLKEKGANYTGTPVEQDGLIITADGPNSATAFGEKIAEALS